MLGVPCVTRPARGSLAVWARGKVLCQPGKGWPRALAQTRYIPINYPPTPEEQLCYVVDDRDLSTDEKFVLMTLMADHYRYGRETTVAELF